VIEASAREFCKGYPAPAFIKLAVGEWVFVGNYRVVKHSKDPTVIEQHQKKAELLGRSRKGSDKITQVLDLEPVGDYFDLRDGSGKIKRADRERNSPIPTETVESGSHPFQAAPLAL
jgi:hypothetical protein